MRKLVCAAIAIVAMCAFVAPASAEKMMFGVKGGVNWANVVGDNAENKSTKMGAVGGVFFSYDLSDIWAIQPELHYSQKGAVAELEVDDVLQEYDWKTDYLVLPILFKLTLPTAGNIKPLLYLGPEFGILISAKLGDMDIKDELASLDVGGMAGGGVGYVIGKGMLSLEARYEMGLISIDSAETGEEEADMKNSVISVLLGYGFSF